MKLQVVSDLHLEFEDMDIPNAGDTDVLVLSGDILVGNDLHEHPPRAALRPAIDMPDPVRRQNKADRFRDFLDRMSRSFTQVIYVAGNHEFYHGKFYATLDHLRAECDRYPNIHFLECDTVTLGDVMFVGATIWTDCNRNDPMTQHVLMDSMNDYRVIRNDRAGYAKLRPAHTIQRHKETMAYLQDTVDSAPGDKKIVIVGHHAPTYKSIHPKYVGDHTMNGGYASDLSDFILDRPEIVLWTHGHVHNTCDYMVGTTRVFCNPRGYAGYGERTGWDPLRTIEL